MAELNARKRNGKWEYRFEAAKIDGKRKQVTKGGFTTKKECLSAGARALAEYNSSGLTFIPSEISVSDYLDYWLDSYCKMNLKYNTQLGYLNIIENHLKPYFGHYKLKALNASAIQDYANKLKLDGAARSTMTGIISTLSGALNYAVEPLHYIQFNPCNHVKYPKYDKPKESTRYILSPVEFSKITARFDQKSQYHLPLMIGYYTGLRISEAFALTWDDIDMDNRTLTVNKITVKRNHGIDVRQVLKKKGKKEEKSAWYFGTPKTLSSSRTIKFGETLYNAFRYAKTKQAENKLFYGEYYTAILKNLK
ncbi:MAG: tyrosine-type recombinase/integrase [Eubacterium sp.]